MSKFTVPMMVRVSEDVYQVIEKYAENEERSIANMVRVLLNEALRARHKKIMPASKAIFKAEATETIPKALKVPK